MPFPFSLPTTSSVSFARFFSSPTHPSLPLVATNKRSIVKDALKRHKRLPLPDQARNLPSIQDALLDYLPYLLAIEAGTKSHDVCHQRVAVDTAKPLETAWRTTLSDVLPGREPPRPRLIGLQSELAFTLSTLAYVYTLLARSQLRSVYEASDQSINARNNAIASAMKYLLLTHAVHIHALTHTCVSHASNDPVDVQPPTLSGLASLALAEATLAVIAKDDPYAAAVADDRNEKNTDWMYKSPSIPKPRASLYTRICLAAADHACQAQGLLSRSAAGNVDDALLKYVSDLRRTARAKAIRFAAINAELAGSTGEALAWLNGAKRELGLTSELEDGKRKGFRGLKQTWKEHREDRKIERGGEWGLDAGRLEEARVIEMLEAKWDRENSTVNVQIVPPFEPLLQTLPSGREYHDPERWSPPTLDEQQLMDTKVIADPADTFVGIEEDSGDEMLYGRPSATSIGAFPGSNEQHERHDGGNAYF